MVFASPVWMLELDNSGSHWQYSNRELGVVSNSIAGRTLVRDLATS